MATPGLLKLTVYWNKRYDVIIPVDDVTNQVFITWFKFLISTFVEVTGKNWKGPFLLPPPLSWIGLKQFICIAKVSHIDAMSMPIVPT